MQIYDSTRGDLWPSTTLDSFGTCRSVDWMHPAELTGAFFFLSARDYNFQPVGSALMLSNWISMDGGNKIYVSFVSLSGFAN